jgi:hypothetical protein
MRYEQMRRWSEQRAIERRRRDIDVERLWRRGEFPKDLDEAGCLRLFLTMLETTPWLGERVRRRFRGCPQGGWLVMEADLEDKAHRRAVGVGAGIMGLSLLGIDVEDGVISLVFEPAAKDNCQAPIWWGLELDEERFESWWARCDDTPVISEEDGRVCEATRVLFAEQRGQRVLAMFQQAYEGRQLLHLLWDNLRVTSFARVDGEILIFDNLFPFGVEEAVAAHTIAVWCP